MNMIFEITKIKKGHNTIVKDDGTIIQSKVEVTANEVSIWEDEGPAIIKFSSSDLDWKVGDELTISIVRRGNEFE